MKKLLFIVAIAGVASLIACGPSAEQKAAMEKAKADSVAAAHSKDSLMQASKKQHMDDSIKAAQMKVADTTKPAESKEEKK
jgi:hypothetical protein